MRMLLLALVVGATALAGCAREDDENATEATPPPGDAFVEVLLDEYRIRMPSTAPAGTISFEISNTGDNGHSFAISGPGVDRELDDDLRPTETAVMTLELVAGTYTVWCPIGDHRDRGMEAELTVTAGEADDGDTLDGIGPSEQPADIDG